MTKDDIPRFLKSLADMGILFADELTKERQRIYWRTLNDTMTIDEWQYACEQAMARSDFHKVPLPAALIAYAMERRRAEDQCLAARARERELLTAGPSQFLGTPEENLANVRALIASVWPDNFLKDSPGELAAQKAQAKARLDIFADESEE